MPQHGISLAQTLLWHSRCPLVPSSSQQGAAQFHTMALFWHSHSHGTATATALLWHSHSHGTATATAQTWPQPRHSSGTATATARPRHRHGHGHGPAPAQPRHRSSTAMATAWPGLPPYLLPLHQLLVGDVGEGAQWAELAGALGAHEDAVLIDHAPAADGDQWHPVAPHVLVQVDVPTLHLGAGGDGPGWWHGVISGCWGAQAAPSPASTPTTRCHLLGGLGVPDHDISVGAGDDPALAGVQVVDLGGVGAGHSHKAVLIHLTPHLPPEWA